MLNLNDVSKLSLLEKVATPLGLPLPDYVPSKGVMKSATDLLNEKGYKVSRNQFYKRAIVEIADTIDTIEVGSVELEDTYLEGIEEDSLQKLYVHWIFLLNA